jgi:hypothetical protein
MNTKLPPAVYDQLRPEERFRLILAAGGRRDEAERDRLVRAGQRLVLSFPDHAPWSHAFQEVALLTMLELLDAAAWYLEMLAQSQIVATKGDDEMTDEELMADDEDGDVKAVDARDLRRHRRFIELSLSAGYVLKTRAEGWALFCQRLGVPPLLLWTELPGFDILQGALTLAEKAAFTAEGFLKWLKRTRRPEMPKMTEVPLTIEGLARAKDEMYRARAAWWGGE